MQTLDQPFQSNVCQPEPNVTLLCHSTQNQCSHSNVLPPIGGIPIFLNFQSLFLKMRSLLFNNEWRMHHENSNQRDIADIAFKIFTRWLILSEKSL